MQFKMNRKIIIFLFIFILPVCLSAQIFSTPAELAVYVENAPSIYSRSAVLIDAETGVLLYSKNPNVQIPPASLTKLMTIHLIMQAINEGKTTLDSFVEITAESWAQSQPRGSSLMFLEPGQIVTLREIILGLSVPSGNDAAVAAALHISPTMADFTSKMNSEAKQMGLFITRFSEAAGISSRNRTTAAEFALFSRQYVNMYPNNLTEFHSVTSFAYPQKENMPENRTSSSYQTIIQNNPNALLNALPGVDGLKTGYIGASGHNISLTAKRDQTRFILVLLGAGSAGQRTQDGIHLLSWAFDNFKTVRPEIDYSKEAGLFTAQLWKGKADEAELTLAEPESFTSHISRNGSLKYETVITETLIAPLPAGYHAGYLYITDDQGELCRKPLVTKEAYEQGNIFKRIWHSIVLMFKK